MATSNKDLKIRLSKDTRNVTTESKDSAPAEKPVFNTDAKPKKKKVGRPKTKTEDCKTINIAVPVSLLKKMNVAKITYKDNLTLYINKLIEKDIEKHYEDYKKFAELQEAALK